MKVAWRGSPSLTGEAWEEAMGLEMMPGICRETRLSR